MQVRVCIFDREIVLIVQYMGQKFQAVRVYGTTRRHGPR
jgi:hypothetical protein